MFLHTRFFIPTQRNLFVAGPPSEDTHDPRLLITFPFGPQTHSNLEEMTWQARGGDACLIVYGPIFIRRCMYTCLSVQLHASLLCLRTSLCGVTFFFFHLGLLFLPLSLSHLRMGGSSAFPLAVFSLFPFSRALLQSTSFLLLYRCLYT